MAVNPIMSSGRGTIDAFGAGVQGIRAGLRGMDHAAQEIAELNVRDPSGAEPTDRLANAAEALVDLTIYKRNVQAAAVVVQTADETLGFLLDVHA
jgi:hypothetical protein